MPRSRTPAPQSAFTLVELLVVLGIIAVLASLVAPAIGGAGAAARCTECAAKLRTLANGVLLYCNDHNAEFPRSFHSGGTHREPGWAMSVAPYIGLSEKQISDPALWEQAFNDLYRSPADNSRDLFIYSYALNVHFELDPNGDDYTGAPETWRRTNQVPRPSRTLLFGQPRSIAFGDHLMCHQWSGMGAAKNALNHMIHRGRANYAFADGHVETLVLTEVFDPAKGVNLWNPSLAR